MMNLDPSGQAARLEALRRYDLLDAPPDDGFDDLTHLAAQICGTPISLISLVDAHRQRFLSRVGIEAQETPLDVSFCAHAIRNDALFEVPDATEDARFRENRLVTGSPHIRYYAGVPLRTPDSWNLGTLCVIDRVPRKLVAEQKEALTRLGRQVMGRMELRRAAREKARLLAFQEAILTGVDSAIVMTNPQGLITALNPAASRLFGYVRKDVVGVLAPIAFHDRDEIAARAAELAGEVGHDVMPGCEVLLAHARAGMPETREWTCVRKDGTRFPALLTVNAVREQDRVAGFVAIVRDLSERRQVERVQRSMEARLRQMIEGVKDYAIFMLDAGGNVKSWNAGARHIKGYSAREVMGRHFSKFFLPADVIEGKPERALKIAAEEGRFEEEGWRVRKDGVKIMAHSVITALFDEGGGLCGFTEITRDLSGRKDTES